MMFQDENEGGDHDDATNEHIIIYFINSFIAAFLTDSVPYKITAFLHNPRSIFCQISGYRWQNLE